MDKNKKNSNFLSVKFCDMKFYSYIYGRKRTDTNSYLAVSKICNNQSNLIK